MAKRDSDLFDRLRQAGMRKQVAKTLSGVSESAGKKAQRAARSAAGELRTLADEIERRLPDPKPTADTGPTTTPAAHRPRTAAPPSTRPRSARAAGVKRPPAKKAQPAPRRPPSRRATTARRTGATQPSTQSSTDHAATKPASDAPAGQ
jgi:hypothetical protein